MSTTPKEHNKPTRKKCTKPQRSGIPRTTHRRNAAGFTFLEAIVVTALVLLIATLVSVRLFGWSRNSRLERDAGRFARTLRVAAREAAIRQRNVAVSIDIYDGWYTVYEANEQNDYDDVEPLIASQGLNYYWIDKIDYADGTSQRSGRVIITIAPTGFQSSLLFSLIDRDDRSCYLRCDHFTPNVFVSQKPLELPETRTRVSFTTPF